MRIFFAAMLIALITTAAQAQIPTKGNVFFGYSFDRTPIFAGDTSSLNGWEATLEGKFLPWIGLVVDVDGHYGSHNYGGTSADIAEHNVLFGPRVSVQIKRFRPFGELLFGVSHVGLSNGLSNSDTSFANGAGGGLDYRIAGPVTWRNQIDWINTRSFSNGQDGVRFSTGIAFHF